MSLNPMSVFYLCVSHRENDSINKIRVKLLTNTTDPVEKRSTNTTDRVVHSLLQMQVMLLSTFKVFL